MLSENLIIFQMSKGVIRKTAFSFSRLYDTLFEIWECKQSRQWQANLLVAVFLGSLVLIELSRSGIIPPEYNIPTNHFYAVKLAFDLLLLLEVLGLVFNLATSVANSMGKQFEILSLILLRQSFKEFVNFEEPIEWEQASAAITNILSDSFGALIIFALVMVFYMMQRHRKITDVADELASFVVAKKLLALLLLTVFVVAAFHNLYAGMFTDNDYSFFGVFYTVLIFSDVLLVLISLRYNSNYNVVFRNSGFALATVIIRIALTAPPVWNVALGISAVLLSIGLTFVYNNFQLFSDRSKHFETQNNM